MLPLISGWARNCERTDRRSFLKIGSLGGLGMTLPLLLEHQQGLAKEGKPSKPVNCIFIWTLGGTSHHDTLDPKPEAAANVKGPFGVIDTAVPGVKLRKSARAWLKRPTAFPCCEAGTRRTGVTVSPTSTACRAGSRIRP